MKKHNSLNPVKDKEENIALLRILLLMVFLAFISNILSYSLPLDSLDIYVYFLLSYDLIYTYRIYYLKCSLRKYFLT
jgi:hypothetical protein